MQPRAKVALVQDGARGHYGLALALQRAGLLEVMYTDFMVRRGSMWEYLGPAVKRFAPTSVKRMLERQCPELDPGRVVTNLTMRLRQNKKHRQIKEQTAFHRWQAEDTGRWVAGELRETTDILMGFIRHMDPGLCRVARSRGIMTVGDQMIAPMEIEIREQKIQQERFPGWEKLDIGGLQDVVSYERESWASLDAITCPVTIRPCNATDQHPSS